MEWKINSKNLLRWETMSIMYTNYIVNTMNIRHTNFLVNMISLQGCLSERGRYHRDKKRIYEVKNFSPSNMVFRKFDDWSENKS